MKKKSTCKMKKKEFASVKRFTLNVFGFLAFLINSNVYGQLPDYVPNYDKVAYYLLNQSAKDEISGKSGTVNSATATTDRLGVNSNAYYFSSVNGGTYINVNMSNAGNIASSGALTINAWFNRSGAGHNGPRMLHFNTGPSATTDDPGTAQWGWENSNNYGYFGIRTDDNGTSKLYQKDFNSVNDNVWFMLTITVDANFVTWYQDGVKIHSEATVGNVKLVPDLSIGRMAHGGNDAFNGKIDDIGVWSRALKANEVKQLYTRLFTWTGTDNITYPFNWGNSTVPGSTDSVFINSGIMTVNQATTLDVLKINASAQVKLGAPLTVRNLSIYSNGYLDLNGYKLTVTGQIYQDDPSRSYIQAGFQGGEKKQSELVFAPTANTSSTLYLNPYGNTLKLLELGTATKTAQVTLGNAVKIKGGKPSNLGSLKINNGSRLIIPSGTSLTLVCDTFNAYLDAAAPAKRVIDCKGTGTFGIQRQHYGARGWRLYSHPFSSDIDLTQIADDIDLIGSGGITEGFQSNVYLNDASFWYDYSQADSTTATDLAWKSFTSAKGTLISSNPNKWKKHAPIMVFNPGMSKGGGAFSNPNSPSYYTEGNITLSYVLDSTAVHLNDGKTQTISTADLIGAPKSRYFLLTNPFTAPVRLGRIQGLNLTNCANKFYYWKQNQASISSYFMPAAWASEALFNGDATRDSNISIPAFGTILIEMKSSALTTTFTIPESAKQLTNFDYLIGGNISVSNSGVKQTLFMEIPQTYQGPGGVEVQLLMNDSVPVDGMLIYDRVGESPFFTNNDAKKFKESSFANIYSLAKGGESLSLDAQDITSRLNTGETQVEIPLVIERDFNKAQGSFRLRIWEKHSELQTYFKDAKTGQEYPAESFDNLPIAFEADETVINRYSLVFKRNSSSTEDLTEEKEALTSNSKMDIIVYPNPVNDYVDIRIINNTQFSPYALYASDGKVVKTGTIKNFETLDMKSLSKGIYYLNCNGNSIKIIKQ